MVQIGRRRRRSRATICSRSRPTRCRWRCRRPPPACSAEIRVSAGEVAPVGAVVGVIARRGPARRRQPRRRADSAPRKRRRPQHAAAPPPACAAAPTAMPAPPAAAAADQARSVLRGAHAGSAISARRSSPSGIVVTPLARRLAGEAGIDLVAAARLRPARPHRRPRRRDSAPRPAPPQAARSRRTARAPIRSRRSTTGQLRGSAARRACAAPSRRGWRRPSRPSRISI